MSYYMRGDYYRGDYYRGDPGFLKSLGKIAGGIVSSIVPGKLGDIAGTALSGGSVPRALGLKPAVQQVVQSTPAIQMPSVSLPGGVQVTGPKLTLGPGGIPQFLGFGPQPAGGGNPCERGFHLDKKTRTKCVRNRSMNVLNPRALNRGLRRAEGFERIARRTVNALRSGPKKFKARAKKRR